MLIMNVPRVSIGLPVWNGEKYLRLALDAVLKQDYSDFELIISDNASTDATENICREYAAKDPRIRYYRNEKNIGATGNFNRVFELARGEYFKWISHDDQIASAFLKRCVETFQQAPADTVLVCSSSQLIDGSGQVLVVLRRQMKSSPHPSCRLASIISSDHQDLPYPLWGLIRSESLRQTRLMGIVEADHVLLAELALLGNFVEIPEELQMWRHHAENALNLCRTSRQLLAWHDPSKAGNRIVLSRALARDLEYFRLVRHVRLSAMEQIKCYCVLSWLLFPRFFRDVIQPLRGILALRTRLQKWFPKLVRQPSKWEDRRPRTKHDTIVS